MAGSKSPTRISSTSSRPSSTSRSAGTDASAGGRCASGQSSRCSTSGARSASGWGIRDIPADYAEFERYNIEYEQRHYRYTEANRRVGAATVELFANWFPRILRPLVRRAIHALLDA